MRVFCNTLIGTVSRVKTSVEGIPEMTWGELRQQLESHDMPWSRVAGEAGVTSIGSWLPLIGDTWPRLQPGFFLRVEPSLGIVLLAESGSADEVGDEDSDEIAPET